MNERIRELAEHCDFYVGNEHYEESYEEKQRLWTEKFAELILQECMDRSTWVGKMNTTPIEPIHTAHAINKRIRQHFGVEE